MILTAWAVLGCSRPSLSDRPQNLTGSADLPDRTDGAESSESIARASAEWQGVFALTAGMRPIPKPLLAHPDVTGIVVRGGWKDVEPSRGQFEWTYFERELDRIAQSGKLASLVVSSGGVNTPAWLFEEGVSAVTFTDPNRFHESYGQPITIPQFWDAKLLEAKLRLISAMGQRFGARPELELVSAQCANATTDDWNLLVTSPVEAERWRGVGFTEAKLFDACKRILDATMEAFPTQFVRMAVGRVPASLTSRPDGVVQDLVAYADERYPGRFIIQRHNLSARTPVPSEGGWEVVVEHRSRNAAQFLWPAADTKSCRLLGSTPCDPLDAFRRTVDVALAYQLQYVEVYTADLMRPELEAEVQRLAHGLRGGSPPPVARQAPPLYPGAERPGPDRGPGPWPPPGQGRGRGVPNVAGTIEHHTFIGGTTGVEIAYSIYFPPSYAAGSASVPVVYWLHGKGGDEQRSVHVARFLEDAIEAGQIPECIMVFPRGGAESFYTDASTGAWPIETMILNELVPHVETEYRARRDRGGRALMGFSMGGFGSLKFAAKYPDRFAAVVAYGAPRTDVSLGMNGNDRGAFVTAFNGDLATFEQNTPSYWFGKHVAEVQRTQLVVRLVVGSADGTRFSMAKIHDILTGLGIAHEYEVLDGVPHVVAQYYEREAGRGFAVLGRAFTSPP